MPAPTGELQSDARAALGNRTTRVVLAQPKLTVGASRDPLELEADDIAAKVARSIIGGAPDLLRRSATTGAAPIGPAGGDVRAAEETQLEQIRRGGGSALPPAFRSKVETAMGADFSGVRVHSGAGADRLSRSFGADAFTVGKDIFFRDGLPDVSTSAGVRLVAHELTHTVQQGGVPSSAPTVSRSVHPAIQRHSSFEHLMLGNVRPTDLAKVGAWQDAIKQTAAATPAKGGGGKAAAEVQVAGLEKPIKKADIMHVLLQEMLRLKQWQERPPTKSSAEQAAAAPDEFREVGKDPDFQVVTVRLADGLLCTYGELNTLGDYFGSVEVLKGADKNKVWELLQGVREETWTFLQETFEKLSKSLTEAEQKDKDVLAASESYQKDVLIPNAGAGGVQGFAGAMAGRISGMSGQIELMGGMQGTGAQGKTNAYKASLGRNACHFVPDSWNAWAENHAKARVLAKLSRQHSARLEVERPQLKTLKGNGFGAKQRLVDQLQAQAAETANEAILTNGFGDHFLQDSYAAGHMINKTQIMQWYVEFIDKTEAWDYAKDKNWRKAQNIAYTQNLAPVKQYDRTQVQGYGPQSSGKAMDPQSVENRSTGDWKKNFEELGLQVPPSLRVAGSRTREVFDWFQTTARAGTREVKGKAICDAFRDLKPLNVQKAVEELMADGVVRTDVDVAKRGQGMAGAREHRREYGSAHLMVNPGMDKVFVDQKFILRADYVPKQPARSFGDKVKGLFGRSSAPAKPALTPEQREAAEREKQEQFKAIAYNDYLEFIQSAFIQKSTNALHDTFCKAGLTVYDGAGTEIGKVYGDDSMFNESSAAGVKHSGETANMSRDAILNIINGGAEITEKQIIDRFPAAVQTDVTIDGKVVRKEQTSLADWHNTAKPGNLKKIAFDKIFPSLSWQFTNKLVVGAAGSLGTFFKGEKPPHAPF